MTTQTGLTGRYRTKTSNGIETSVGGDELVRFDDPNLTVKQYKRISFYADADCEVIRNGDEKLFITKGGGMNLDDSNTPTTSLVIITPSVPFYFMANY